MQQINNVLVFTLIAFSFSWLFWIPDALIAQNIWDAPKYVENFLSGPMNLAPWGPLFSAIVTTFLFRGNAGVKELLKRGTMIHLGKWWWIILLTFPVLIGGALGLSILLGAPVPEFPALSQPFTLPIVLIWIFFLGGPLQEEFGWRGYAFANLRNTYNGLIAAITAGLLWGLWHLPLFFVPRAEYYYNRPVWGLLLTTVLVGIIFAWFYANTKGSVFAAILGHAMFNWSNYVFPTLGSDSAALILLGFYFAMVAFILWQFGTKTFRADLERGQHDNKALKRAL